jgi:hypothetical protein
MRKRTTATTGTAAAYQKGDLAVCVLDNHSYNGREGYMLHDERLPAGYVNVKFSDGYIGIFRAEDIGTVAA